MSVALESIGGGGGRGGGSGGGSRYNIDTPGFISRIPFMAMYGSSDPPIGGFGAGCDDKDSSSYCSSSIGKNSDLSVDSAEVDEPGENEVQSDLKGPLDTLDSLEDVLPVKKSISNFYSGKSKSFTSLAEASVISSINDLAKPETSYSKKRKNMLASTVYWEKKGGKTSKHSRIVLYRQETIGTQGALNHLSAVYGSEANSSANSNSCSFSSLHGLPPLHPQSAKGTASQSVEEASPTIDESISPCRSLSLSDLQSSTSTPSSASVSPSSSGTSPSSAAPFSAGAPPSTAGVSSSSTGVSPSSASSSGGK